MQIPVIHFTTLADLLAELDLCRHVVRVAASQRTESREGAIPSRLYSIVVDVRALSHGAILSYRAMQEEIQVDFASNRKAIVQQYAKAWDDAIKVRTAICAVIANAGHDARPGIIDLGIIDLGNVQPITGEQWPLSETDHAL